MMWDMMGVKKTLLSLVSPRGAGSAALSKLNAMALWRGGAMDFAGFAT